MRLTPLSQSYPVVFRSTGGLGLVVWPDMFYHCRQENEITWEEIYSTHTTKKVGYVVERDQPRCI